MSWSLQSSDSFDILTGVPLNLVVISTSVPQVPA